MFLFSPFPLFHAITFCLGENTGTLSLGTVLSLLWLFLFQPLQTVQSFQQELPLLSVALSPESLLGRVELGLS